MPIEARHENDEVIAGAQSKGIYQAFLADPKGPARPRCPRKAAANAPEIQPDHETSQVTIMDFVETLTSAQCRVRSQRVSRPT